MTSANQVVYIEMGDSAMVFQVRWWIESYRMRVGCLTRCTWPCRTPSTMPGMTRPFPKQTLNLQTNSEMADLISHKFGGQKQKSAGTGLGWRRAGNLYHLSISGRRLNAWYCAFLTIQDDPYIAPCCLLALPVQYRRAEPKRDSFSPVKVGFSCDCSGRGLSPLGPLPSGVRVRYIT